MVISALDKTAILFRDDESLFVAIVDKRGDEYFLQNANTIEEDEPENFAHIDKNSLSYCAMRKIDGAEHRYRFEQLVTLELPSETSDFMRTVYSTPGPITELIDKIKNDTGAEYLFHDYENIVLH